MTKKLKPAPSPWQHPQWEPGDASAIQALFAGNANDVQQRRAINWIVNECCALQYWPYDPANEKNTHIALGRHFVGHEIVRLMRLKVGQFKED